MKSLFLCLALSAISALVLPIEIGVENSPYQSLDLPSLPHSQEEKRGSWSNFRGSWGKRAGWNSLRGTWGKRDKLVWLPVETSTGSGDSSALIQDLEVLPASEQFWDEAESLSKRSRPYTPNSTKWPLRGSWGKRADWSQLRGTWGKRGRDWSQLRGSWGKRNSAADTSNPLSSSLNLEQNKE